MADYSLVPVDYLPEFEGVSLVPVDHDPFGVVRGDINSGSQSALSFSNYNERIGAQSPQLVDGSSIYSDGSSAPSLNVDPKDFAGSSQRYSMASHAAYGKCVDKCLHLLPSPSGDLQSSEFRLCVAQCMGRL